MGKMSTIETRPFPEKSEVSGLGYERTPARYVREEMPQAAFC